jgi:cystathionine beta-lyase
MKKKTYKEDTNIIHSGRNPAAYHGVVNPPVVHASSIIYESYADYKNTAYRYARNGTPLSDSFEEAMAALEGGYGAVSTPSGQMAITTALSAFLKAGDHILVSDALYPPVREFCDNFLKRYGVETTYYDPMIGKGIEKLCRKNTKLIYIETPGAGTYEIIDVPAIVAVAKKKKIITMTDNSWAAGVLYRPIEHGVDISVQSVTKYVSGHSDLMLGVAVAATPALYKTLKKRALELGVCAGADEMYLALRGLRTIKVRMKQHEENVLKVVKWLQKCKEIERINCPALPGSPGHAIWKRDYSGTNGLISIQFKPISDKAYGAFIDALQLFPLAASWGGYESLAMPLDPSARVAVKWAEKGPLLRLHIGLEDPDDLIADLQQALKRLKG